MRENKDPGIIKIITVVIVGVGLVSGAVASAFKIADDAKTYTDANIRYLRDEQTRKLSDLQSDISEMKDTLSRVETIVEERLGPPKSTYPDFGRGDQWKHP